MGLVVAADVLVLAAGAVVLPGLLPFSVPLLALVTVWGLARPGGWGAFALVLAQVLVVGVSWGVPESVADWALAALTAAAVLVTHLVLALLAAFPPGAALPGATLRRWAGQGGVLAALGGVAAGVGTVAAGTPAGWWQWLVAAALLLLAASATSVWWGTRRA